SRIPKDELAGFDGPPLTRQRLEAAPLYRRLVDAVLVAEWIEISGLRAEVLHVQDADAREALVLFPKDRDDSAPILLGIAECAHSDMSVTRSERRLPVLGIVDSDIP